MKLYTATIEQKTSPLLYLSRGVGREEMVMWFVYHPRPPLLITPLLRLSTIVWWQRAWINCNQVVMSSNPGVVTLAFSIHILTTGSTHGALGKQLMTMLAVIKLDKCWYNLALATKLFVLNSLLPSSQWLVAGPCHHKKFLHYPACSPVIQMKSSSRQMCPLALWRTRLLDESPPRSVCSTGSRPSCCVQKRLVSGSSVSVGKRRTIISRPSSDTPVTWRTKCSIK